MDFTLTEDQQAFRDTARQVVDETIDLELSRGAVGEAFRVSDARQQLRSTAATQLPVGAAATGPARP